MEGHQGEYCGMLVRGSGETFNLIVPIRRMAVWAKKVGVEWAINDKVDPPYLGDLLNESIEDIGVSFTSTEKAQLSNDKYNLKFMIRDTTKWTDAGIKKSSPRPFR